MRDMASPVDDVMRIVRSWGYGTDAEGYIRELLEQIDEHLDGFEPEEHLCRLCGAATVEAVDVCDGCRKG